MNLYKAYKRVEKLKDIITWITKAKYDYVRLCRFQDKTYDLIQLVGCDNIDIFKENIKELPLEDCEINFNLNLSSMKFTHMYANGYGLFMLPIGPLDHIQIDT